MSTAFFRWSLALGVGLLAAGAHAQYDPDPKELILGSQIHHAFSPAARAELHIDEKLFQKLVDCFEGSMTVQDDRIMIMHDPSLDMEKCKKNAMALLSADQKKRLFEIWLQVQGGLGIGDDEVAKKLKLSDEQKSAVNKLFAETAKRLQDTFTMSPDESTHKQYLEIRKGAAEKALALLTDEQQKSLEELKGKPFNRKKDGG